MNACGALIHQQYNSFINGKMYTYAEAGLINIIYSEMEARFLICVVGVI